MFRATLTALCATALLSTSVSAEVIMDQNFDDTDTFTTSTDTFTGTNTTPVGRWGPFAPDGNGPYITDQFSFSGDQALTVRRDGSQPIGHVYQNGVSEDEFEISYWVYRHASNSSVMIQAGDGDVTDQTQLGVFINNGTIYVRSTADDDWITTDYGVGVGEWTRLRQHVTVSNGVANFDLYRTQGAGGTEQLLGSYEVTMSNADAPEAIDRLRFNPQGTSGNETTFDDVLITQVPEPASFGLMLAGGAMMLLRKRRHA